MEITCTQMDVLISFYIEGDLNDALKKKVEEHLKQCSTCRAKFGIIKTMLEDLKETVDCKKEQIKIDQETPQYKDFQNNLSAYVDNELPTNESIKIKKYTINNKLARKELEDTYTIRKLMSESFSKSKIDAKQDFAKNIMKKLNPNYYESYSFNPILKIIVPFIFSVLILSAIVIFSLTL